MGIRRCLVVALSGAALLPAASAADAPLPYRVRVTAEYGKPLGPESLREDLERKLVARLRDSDCFEGVDRLSAETAGHADLIVEVILDRIEESTEYDVGIATQHRSDTDPETRLQWTASAEAVLYIQVRRAGDQALVKMDRSHAAASRQALPGADARQEVYTDLVDSIVRKTRSYLCKPSVKKWEKQIREARAD